LVCKLAAEGRSVRVSVLVVGFNYRTAPVGLLERLAVPQERLGKAIHSLTTRDHVAEAVVLSTCNRVEVYAAVTRYHGAMGDIRNFFGEWGGIAPEDFASIAYDYYDDRAAAHLFAVAAGLDSMVVGERQIHLQVRQAFKDAQAHGSAGRMLGALFRQSLRVGRRVRSETEVSAGGASMVDAGLQAADRVLGTVDGGSALIVGAGMMGGLAGSRLAERAGSITVMNRSVEKAERLAARVGATVTPMARIWHALSKVDLVVTSTASTEPVLTQDDVEAAMAGRPDRPLVLLDLAVPRDVDPGCSAVPGVTVLDIDAVRELSDTGATGAAVSTARAIVDEEAAGFAAWTRTVGVEPVIGALRAKADAVRRAELDRVSGKLAGLDDRQRSAVEAMSKSIVARLLHEPSVRLKQIADQRGAEQYANAIQELFDLDEPQDS
jgi:glutamyl-tRNA reductase